jgi:hypothetical protein
MHLANFCLPMDCTSAPAPHLREPAAKTSQHSLLFAPKPQEPPIMRIKALPLVGSILLVISGCDKTTSPSTSQNTDPVVARNLAQTLTIGTPQTGTLRKAEVDWFKFAVDSGRTYSIQQSCPQSPCPEARTLTAQWKSGNTVFDSSISGLLRFTAVKTDSVYLSIEGQATTNGVVSTSFGYWDSVNYALELVDEYALSIGNRNDAVLMVDDGVVRTWDLKKDRSRWYRFHVDSGTFYRIDKNCPVQICPEFTTFRFFLDSAAAPFLTSTTAPAGFTASRSGTAYLQIEGTTTENGKFHTSFSYWTSLHLSLSLNSYDPDVLVNATTIPTDGSIVQGSLAKTEIVWYKFLAKGNTPYRIQKSCNTPSCLIGNKITLVSESSMEVFATSNTGLLNFTTTAPGIVLIKLQGSTGDDTGPYTLWAVEYDTTKAETMGAAIEIQPGVTSQPRAAHWYGRPSYNWSFDTTWFRFHADSGKTYKFTHPDRELSLQSASFWTIDSVPVSFAVANSGETEEAFACTKTGTYFLRFVPWPTNPDGYSAYSVRLETSDHLPFWFTGVDEYEPDSTMHTASIQKPDSAAMHHTLPANDVDWTRIPVDSGKVYLIGIREALRPFTFSLYAADSTLLQFQMTDGNSFYPSIKGGRLAMSYRAPATTDIFVRISSLGEKLEYDLRAWSPIQDSYEFDDTIASAKPIPTDGTIQHRLLNGSYDFIKFHADSGKKYWLNLHVSNSITVMGYSISYSGRDTTPDRWRNRYTSFDSDRDQDVFLAVDPHVAYTDEPALLATIRYEASVTIDSGDGYESDNTLSTAKSQATGGTIAHHSLTESDIDWISFDVDSGATYSINIANPEAAYISAGLYTVDGAQIGNVVEGRAPTLTLQANGRRKTTYNLQVTSPWYSGPPVKYDVSIQSSKSTSP